jgi:hypothetical protein
MPLVLGPTGTTETTGRAPLAERMKAMYHVAVWDEYDGWEIVHSTPIKENAEWWKRKFQAKSPCGVEMDAEIFAW